MLCAAVMQSEAFLHLKESCPSMLLELLETFASVDDNSGQTLSGKRSGSNQLIQLAGVSGGVRKSNLKSVSSTLKSYETVCLYE